MYESIPQVSQNINFHHSNKLPSIEIIQFHGKIDKRLPIEDLYVTSNHNDPNI